MGAGEYAAPGYRHHSLNFWLPVDPQQFPSLLFKDQGVFPGQSEGYAYLGAGIIVLDRCLGHLRAVVPFSFQERFPLASLAGRRARPLRSQFRQRSPLAQVFSWTFLARRLGAPAFHIPGLRAPLLGGLLYRLVLLFRGGVPDFFQKSPNGRFGGPSALQIIDCKSLLTGVHQMLNSKPAPRSG